MDAGNAADFYKHRDKVLWEVEKIASYQRVFRYDPDPLASRLSSIAFLAQQEQLENLARKSVMIGHLHRTRTDALEKLTAQKRLAPEVARGGIAKSLMLQTHLRKTAQERGERSMLRTVGDFLGILERRDTLPWGNWDI
jgi:hypothetical protein